MLARKKRIQWRRWWLLLLLLGAAVTGLILSFHPARPLYIRQQAVEIVSPNGTKLAGTISLPRWSGNAVPAVVIVHGSGPLGREHLLGDTRRLVWEGIAVLAYDKRGVGQSQGEYPRGGGPRFESVLRLLAQDAAAAFESLKTQPGVDPSRVGFFGASQAGWIIPLAAEQLESKPRFQILISGPAISTGVEAYYSQLTGDGTRNPELTDVAEIRRRIEAFAGPTGYDPLPVLKAQKIPTLWLLGDKDESVPTFATVRALEAIRAEGNDSHTVIVYPGADHGLRHATTGEAMPIWSDLKAWLQQIGVIDSLGN